MKDMLRETVLPVFAALLVLGVIAALVYRFGSLDDPDTIKPGVHKINRNMYHTWRAAEATEDCRWAVKTGGGLVVLSSQYSASTRVTLGGIYTGYRFYTNEACGTWAR